MDLFHLSRKKSCLINLVLLILLSMPCVLGYNIWSAFQPMGAGSAVLDLEDFIVSNCILPIGSLIYLLFCVTRYGWGWKNFTEEANAGRGFKFPGWARLYVTILLPLIVLFIFVWGYISKFLLG